MKKAQGPMVRKTLSVEPTVRKTLTVATSRIPWQPVLGLVAAIVLLSVVVLSGEELKHEAPAAPTFTVLHSFAGSPTDGGGPAAGVVQDAAGNLYGTTDGGGASGQGVVFKLIRCSSAASGYDFRVLHTFGLTIADGGAPNGLNPDTASNLYGTTNAGGGSYGGVFELIRCDSAPSGYDYKVLYSLTGGADGVQPQAGLLLDSAGNLYGTTLAGGAYFNGVVFRLTPN
jgi:uncharacterized repeat protein (TIGR03803 family)